jgi:hypothetical protein
MAVENSLLLMRKTADKDQRFQLAGNTFRSRPLVEGWQVAVAGADALNPAEMWDLAHEAAHQTGSFVEPDLAQSWPWDRRPKELLGARPGEPGYYDDQSDKFPEGPGFAWHLDAAYSQLAAAREEIGNLQDRAKVSIGILDVGFDLAHPALPREPLLRKDLARNFMSDQPRDDVSDPYHEGVLQNPGHGTGTLSLLAAPKLEGMVRAEQNGVILGGNPFAEIVPCRISRSVVLLKTSAFAEALSYLTGLGVDVVSMSMGGVASAAWADAVNRAYEAGVTLVTAAGNNFGAPKSTVFPARFQRVIAACGVMANGAPYEAPPGTMSGNYGPLSKMDTALSAYTPNVPWAEINAPTIVDMNGAGTSSATPQIAAAASLWLHKYKTRLRYSDPWMRVEAVRHALFSKAAGVSDRLRLGRGVLRAKDSLGVRPPAHPRLTKRDEAHFSLFRVLTGLGVAAVPPNQEEMFELEIAQLFHRDPELERIAPDPEHVTEEQRAALLLRLAENPLASRALREKLQEHAPSRPRTGTITGDRNQVIPVAPPPRRRVRVYAFDPSLSTQLRTAGLNDTVIEVPWEKLEPGPIGEYVEVVDHDPASRCFYAPVDLDHPHLLASDGFAPAEGNPQFHQQMAYAVAMRTIHNFETALGRKAMWAPRTEGGKESFVGRLRIYPHGLRAQNAFYHPGKKALLFGYFTAVSKDPRLVLPGGVIFSCLSHDVIAHETTHALLDGLDRSLTRPSNPDQLAFHEAFADIVALFQHFSLPNILVSRIAAGDSPGKDALLAGLAHEFGRGIGLHGALRSAIGEEPDPFALERTERRHEPHARGAILVAAVFDAFVRIYDHRSRDLIRLATGGKDVLPPGPVNRDLAGRLAAEAGKAAQHVLEICIRALDYCPPVDLTFGDYFRALITADTDLVPVDEKGYRLAFIEAFRNRGIYPRDIRSLSVDALRWRAPQIERVRAKQPILRRIGIEDLIRRFAREWPTFYSRDRQFYYTRMRAEELKNRLREVWQAADEATRAEIVAISGIDPELDFEIGTLRLAERRGDYGRLVPQVILSIVQKRRIEDPGCSFLFEGGATLLIDPRYLSIDYSIKKDIHSKHRAAATRRFLQQPGAMPLYFRMDPNRRFALLHREGS